MPMRRHARGLRLAPGPWRQPTRAQPPAIDQYKRGFGPVVEAAQTRKATGEARLARVQADGAAQNSYLALISALGIAPTTRLKIADLSRRSLSTAMIGPVERIVAEALARRPDVL